MRKLFIVLVSSFLFIPIKNQGQVLIQNGSFELPGFIGNAVPGQQQKVVAYSTEITGWTVGGVGDVYVHQYPVGPAFSFGPAQDGSYYLDLSGDGAPHASVYQDFSTIPDIQYSLTFYIGAAASPSSTINVQLVGDNVLLDTILKPLTPNASGINWLKETFSFVPDSTITRISFADTSGYDDNISFVDNVSISIVPEPVSTMMFMSIVVFIPLLWRHYKES